jgi:hypothetical protein
MKTKTNPVSYEQFLEVMIAVIAQREENEVLRKSIEPLVDGNFIVTYGFDLCATAVRFLERTMRGGSALKIEGGKSEWYDIEWWLYETNCGENSPIVTIDNEPRLISTLEDLYDLIVEQA